MEILSLEGPTIVVVVDDEGFRFYVPGEQTIWVGGPDVVELLDGFPMPPGAGRNLAETLDELFYGWLSDPSWSVAGQNRWGRPRAVVLERPLVPAQPGMSSPGPSLRLWVDAATGLPLRLRSGPNTELVVRRLDLDPESIHREIAPALPERSQVIEAELVHSDNLRAAAATVGHFLVAPPDGGGVVVTGVRVARNLPGGAFVVEARLRTPEWDVSLVQRGIPGALPGGSAVLLAIQTAQGEAEPAQVRGVRGRLVRLSETVALLWTEGGVQVSLEGRVSEATLLALAERLESIGSGEE